jgi:secreted trypsin-like serine protease
MTFVSKGKSTMRSSWLLALSSFILLVHCIAFSRAQDLSPNEVTLKAKEGGATSRIINGSNAPQGRYPYFVSLQDPTANNFHFCGGALIGK